MEKRNRLEKELPLVIAHRGFRGRAPENTLAAARAAIELGVSWWELDVAASSDGELVVIHDDTLSRTTDAERRFPGREPWSVYDFCLAELESLDAGSWYGETDPFGELAAGRIGAEKLASFKGEKLPTLRAALELTKSAGICVNVEIKDAIGRACHPWIVERAVELVVEYDLVDRVLLSSFNHDYIVRAKKAEPRLRTGALVEEAVEDPVALLDRTRAWSFNPGLDLVTEKDVRACRAAGRQVLVWTGNETADLERLLSWGVTGIFTDFPDRLLALLEGR